MNKRNVYRVLLTFVLAMAMAVPFLTSTRSTRAFVPITGAIYTTNVTCNGVDLNIYKCKEDVYVNGGPQNAHSGSGLPDGSYYIRVTEPNGTVLGKSTTAVVTVTGGAFIQCYRLSDVVLSTSSGFTTNGYDTTTNAGNEYKVWVSTDSAFADSASKTDNFKAGVCDCDPQVDPNCGGGDVDTAEIIAVKFYDANANGINDDGQPITGWG